MDRSQSLEEQQTLSWFTQSHINSIIRKGIIPEWFHGVISRKMAEELLKIKPPGYFLIRVSESRVGYTLSYRASDRCRHFMIDILEGGHYVIVGETMPHRFLQDLIDFHRKTPIMPFNEVLTVACKQSLDDRINYAELVFNKRHQKSNDLLPPSNPIQPKWTNNQSEEEVPPPLPYRQQTVVNSAALHPSSNENRLYPSLEEEVSPVSVSRSWNNSSAKYPPANQPPEIPARNYIPSTEDNQTYFRTGSAPGSPSISRAMDQSTKSDDMRPWVSFNLKNLKKKFIKRNPSLEHTYAEIAETQDVNEYQEITGELSTGGATVYCDPPDVTLSDGVTPYEYLTPPPFAPGYRKT